MRLVVPFTAVRELPHWMLPAARATVAGGLLLMLVIWLVPTALAADPLDIPFSVPQYLVHAIGHGTTSGGVADNFYTLLNGPPDANGHYTIPDGSGGTIGYASDFHVGPLGTPRDVCNVAVAQGIPAQTWTVGYDYNTTFDCSAAGATQTPATTDTPTPSSAPGGIGPSLTCDTSQLDASGSATCTASFDNGTGSAVTYQWYADGTLLAGSGAVQQVDGLASGSHEVQVVAVVSGEQLGPAQTTIERAVPAADRGGLPIEAIAAAAVLAALLAAAALAWQRARNQQVKNACDELGARYRTMVQSRAQRLAGLNQGLAQLAKANTASSQALVARDLLATQRVEAVALLGAAGVIAAGTLAAMAASAAAVGNALSGAFAWVAGGSEAVLDYVPVLAGGAEPALGLGVHAVNAATAAATAAYGDAALLGTGATGIGVATAERIGTLLTSGMTQVDAAMAQADAMRQQLESACQARIRELSELDSQIGDALSKLAVCPGVDPSSLQDPRSTVPGMPDLAGVPPRG